MDEATTIEPEAALMEAQWLLDQYRQRNLALANALVRALAEVRQLRNAAVEAQEDAG